MQFGLIVIGDEILSGRRKDRHFEFFRQLLTRNGFSLRWLQVLPDDPELLVQRLTGSMQERIPVFSCGGIGATPDDFTRECAARAAGVPSVRHTAAKELIEARFGADAYPHRIRMADLPQGSALIPNPYNQVPGFSINEHYFMPGFPDMAHPMAEWVLKTYYPADIHPQMEMSLRVYDASENELMDLMQSMTREYPAFKLFSLPRIGEEHFVELGLHGGAGLDAAFADMKTRLEKLNLRLGT
jgi:molybdopterin-biosynthesis enzyme MoeA-like protein